jgi:stage II sporulation protein E
MVSDGIADQNDDEWLQNLLAGWDGQDADALTQLILRESRSRRGLQDDCAVLSLYLGPGKSSI